MTGKVRRTGRRASSPTARAVWHTETPWRADDSGDLLAIVGLTPSNSDSSRRFVAEVRHALGDFPDLDEAVGERLRPSRLASALRPIGRRSASLAEKLAHLGPESERHLRERGLDTAGLMESLWALHRAATDVAQRLRRLESRGAAGQPARQHVLENLAQIFAKYYLDREDWHRRKVLVLFLRRACLVASISLPSTDHQLIELLPKPLRPAPSR